MATTSSAYGAGAWEVTGSDTFIRHPVKPRQRPTFGQHSGGAAAWQQRTDGWDVDDSDDFGSGRRVHYSNTGHHRHRSHYRHEHAVHQRPADAYDRRSRRRQADHEQEPKNVRVDTDLGNGAVVSVSLTGRAMQTPPQAARRHHHREEGYAHRRNHGGGSRYEYTSGRPATAPGRYSTDYGRSYGPSYRPAQGGYATYDEDEDSIPPTPLDSFRSDVSDYSEYADSEASDTQRSVGMTAAMAALSLTQEPGASVQQLAGPDAELLAVAGWSEADQDYCRRLFEKFSSGTHIMKDGLVRCLQSIGVRPAVDLPSYFRAFDRRRNRSWINFQDFIMGLCCLDKDTPHKGGLLRLRAAYIFRFYSTDGRMLQPEEFRKLLSDGVRNAANNGFVVACRAPSSRRHGGASARGGNSQVVAELEQTLNPARQPMSEREFVRLIVSGDMPFLKFTFRYPVLSKW